MFRIFKKGNIKEKNLGEYTYFKDLIEKEKKDEKIGIRNKIKRQNAFLKSDEPETKISPYEINEEYVPGSQYFRLRPSDSKKYPGLNLEIVKKTPDNTVAAGLKKRTRKFNKKYKTRRHKNQKKSKKSKKTIKNRR